MRVFRIFLYILIILIIILGIIFAYSNATPVAFNYYVGETAIPLSLLLVLVLGIGILLGIFSMIVPLVKLKSKSVRLQRKMKNAQKEVENLRSIPVKEPHP